MKKVKKNSPVRRCRRFWPLESVRHCGSLCGTSCGCGWTISGPCSEPENYFFQNISSKYFPPFFCGKKISPDSATVFSDCFKIKRIGGFFKRLFYKSWRFPRSRCRRVINICDCKSLHFCFHWPSKKCKQTVKFFVNKDQLILFSKKKCKQKTLVRVGIFLVLVSLEILKPLNHHSNSHSHHLKMALLK